MLPILRHFEPLTRREPLENITRMMEDFWPMEDFFGTRDMGRIDLYEDDDRLYVKAEIPGFTRDDIQLTLENNTLHLEASHKGEVEDKGANYYIRERSTAKWARVIRLPVIVEPEKVEATCKDGVLTVSLEKQQKSKTHKIEIR
jgi:HSP20 family protein